jgi:hypothetical protein
MATTIVVAVMAKDLEEAKTALKVRATDHVFERSE